MNITEIKWSLIRQFREAGLETPDLDARALMMAATGLTHTDLITRGSEPLPSQTLDVIADYAVRRLAGEPIDHILGYREFSILKNKPKAHILDLGTGSGAIIISILAKLEEVEGVAVDISDTALEVAQENAAVHNVDGRLTCLQGSWLNPVSGRFDIIVSNPPYITVRAMKDLDVEVKDYDPGLALSGGEDGLMAYRDILAKAANHLNSDGIAAL